MRTINFTVPLVEFEGVAEQYERDVQRRVMRDVSKSRTTKNPIARANMLRIDRQLLREIKRGR